MDFYHHLCLIKAYVKQLKSNVSLSTISTIVLNSRDQYEIFFRASTTHLTMHFAQNNRLKYIGNVMITLHVPPLDVMKILIV